VEIEFPIEFIVQGTPVSLASRLEARDAWKARVRTASLTAIPAPHFASEDRIAATLFYFPAGPMQGDVDNIVKAILDALKLHVFVDDHQVERIVVQKFEPGLVFAFAQPTPKLEEALVASPPILYVRISNDPVEELT
jgi:crossover junction endodeoxyribonuclease RusA